jgi:hypothetical protein
MSQSGKFPTLVWQDGAVVARHPPLSFPLLVHDVVALAQSAVGGSACPDAIEEALRAAAVLHLAGRDYTTLSGGERQPPRPQRKQGIKTGSDTPVASAMREVAGLNPSLGNPHRRLRVRERCNGSTGRYCKALCNLPLGPVEPRGHALLMRHLGPIATLPLKRENLPCGEIANGSSGEGSERIENYLDWISPRYKVGHIWKKQCDINRRICPPVISNTLFKSLSVP